MPRPSSQASSLGTTSAAAGTAGLEMMPTVLIGRASRAGGGGRGAGGGGVGLLQGVQWGRPAPAGAGGRGSGAGVVSPAALMVGMQQELPVSFRAQNGAFDESRFES